VYTDLTRTSAEELVYFVVRKARGSVSVGNTIHRRRNGLYKYQLSRCLTFWKVCG